jgi:hypothetical protein
MERSKQSILSKGKHRLNIMNALWTSELSEINARRPCFSARLIMPRVFVLPRWFCRNNYGAWTYFNFVLITPAQTQCPAEVRHYVLGHEYGHIFGGHVYLQWAWLFAGILYLIGMLTPIMQMTLIALSIKSIVFYKLVHPRIGAEREFYADNIAADLFGPRTALEGSRWMANALGDIRQAERQARLSRLATRAAQAA